MAVNGSNDGSKPIRMHFPSALPPGHTDCAIVSLTMTTGAPRSSASTNRRPSTMSTPRISRNCGVAAMRNGSCPLTLGGTREARHADRRHVEPGKGHRLHGRRQLDAGELPDALERCLDKGARTRIPVRDRTRRAARRPCACRNPATPGCTGCARTCPHPPGARPTSSSGREGGLGLSEPSTRRESNGRRSPRRARSTASARCPPQRRPGRRGRRERGSAEIRGFSPTPWTTDGRSTLRTASSSQYASRRATATVVVARSAASMITCDSSRARVAPRAVGSRGPGGVRRRARGAGSRCWRGR